MKKLELENFRIATLSNPHMIKGGGDGDDTTKTLVCIKASTEWVKKKETTIDGA